MANIKVKFKLNDGTYYDVDKNNGLKSVESLSQSTGQPKEAYYGVIASSGTCDINDVNGEILDMINENKLPNSNMEVKVFANDNQIQEHITTNSEYSNNKTLNLQMENWLYKLDNIQTTFYDGNYTSKNLKQIISHFITQLNNILHRSISISAELQNRAENITYDYVCIPVMSYRSLLDKICYANRMNLIETDNGYLMFVDASTTLPLSNTITHISPNMVIGDIQRDIIVKNKVQKVNYSLAILNVFDNQIFDTRDIFPSINYSTTSMRVSTANDARNIPSYGERYKYDIIRGEYYYLIGTFSIEKSSNIKTINMNNSGFTVDGEKRTTINIPSNGYYGLNESGIQSKWFGSYSPIYTVGVSFSGTPTKISTPLETFSTNYTNSVGGTMVATAGQGSNTLTMTDTGTSYKFTYNITIHQAVYHQRASRAYNESYYTTLDVAEGECRDINKITFNISGQKMVIELNNDTVTYGDATSPDEMTIPQSELITTTSIGDTIAGNIISDYGDGVMTAQLTIACVDMNNKDFSKGQVLKVGEYVQIDKDKQGNSMYLKNNGDPYIWKVVGRKFRYEGVPLIDLTLQETK